MIIVYPKCKKSSHDNLCTGYKSRRLKSVGIDTRSVRRHIVFHNRLKYDCWNLSSPKHEIKSMLNKLAFKNADNVMTATTQWKMTVIKVTTKMRMKMRILIRMRLMIMMFSPKLEIINKLLQQHILMNCHKHEISKCS